jgi:hypothetical protein
MGSGRLGPVDSAVLNLWYRCVGPRATLAVFAALLGVFEARPALAKPYDDTQGRFSLDLPDAWRMEPRFGDVFGMSWKRDVGSGRGALGLVVHVDTDHAVDLKAMVQAVENEHLRTLVRLDKRLADVGGRHALLLEFGAKSKDEGAARVRAYFIEAGGHRYHVELDGPANELRRADGELDGILKSFRTKGGGASDTERAPVSKKPLDSALIVGRWVNDDDLVMMLHADGSFVLGDAKGHYEVVGHTLTFVLPGQGRETFTFVLDDTTNVLTVSSSNLDKPIAYRRTSAPRDPDAESASDPPPEDAVKPEPKPSAAYPEALIGRWRTSGQAGVVLELGSSGEFVMGRMKGRWSVDGERLILSSEQGDKIAYRFEAKGGALRLSGGDLDQARTFRKISGR